MNARKSQKPTGRKVTFLVTRGWGSSPKYWVRASLGHSTPSDAAYGNVGWGCQVLEADHEPFTAMFWVPVDSALANSRTIRDLTDAGTREMIPAGTLIEWPDSGLGCRMGMYARRPFRNLDTALKLLVAAYRDCGYDVRLVDRRDDGGGFA